MWFVGMPVDVFPWHVVQEPGVTPVWLNVAGIQPAVLWQLSQLAVVGR